MFFVSFINSYNFDTLLDAHRLLLLASVLVLGSENNSVNSTLRLLRPADERNQISAIITYARDTTPR